MINALAEIDEEAVSAMVRFDVDDEIVVLVRLCEWVAMDRDHMQPMLEMREILFQTGDGADHVWLRKHRQVARTRWPRLPWGLAVGSNDDDAQCRVGQLHSCDTRNSVRGG